MSSRISIPKFIVIFAKLRKLYDLPYFTICDNLKNQEKEEIFARIS